MTKSKGQLEKVRFSLDKSMHIKTWF